MRCRSAAVFHRCSGGRGGHHNRIKYVAIGDTIGWFDERGAGTAMLRISLSLTVLCWAVACSGQDRSFEADVAPLLEASCLECHGAGTTSGPDLTALGNNLSDPHIFRSWESLYDRVAKGEMPPPEAEWPDPEQVATALAALQRSLTAANRDKQKQQGRVPAQRLT